MKALGTKVACIWTTITRGAAHSEEVKLQIIIFQFQTPAFIMNFY